MKINVIVISGKVHKAEERETKSGSVVEIRFRRTSPKVDSPEPKNADHWHSEWFTAECWDKTAEYAKRVQSGDMIVVEGRLAHQEGTDKETGARREKYIIKAHRIHIVGGTAEVGTPQAAASAAGQVPF